MPDKRIHELVETSDKSGKYIAVDDAALSEALKFDTDQLLDKTQTDALYVKLTGNETVNGIKTWNNNGVFGAGITVTAGGAAITGNSSVIGTFGVGTSTPPYKMGIEDLGSSCILGIKSATTSLTAIYFGDTDLHGRGRLNYDHALDQMEFFTNSSRRVVIDAAGKVGISTATPLEKLHIAGTGSLIQFDANGGLKGTTGSPNTLVVYNNANARMDFNCTYATTTLGGFNFQRNGTSSMLIRGDGKVGIGTITPGDKLTISDAALNGIKIIGVTTGNDAPCGYIRFETDVTGRYSEIQGYRYGSSQAMGLIFNCYQSGGVTKAMEINNLAFVGIGIEPDQLLHIAREGIASASAPRIKIENTHTSIDTGNDFGGIEFYGNDISGGGTGITGYIKSVAVDAGVKSRMEFGTRLTGDASTKMTIDENGNVGIGTTAPNVKLHVVATSGQPALQISRATGQPSIKSTSSFLMMDSNSSYVSLNHFVTDDVVLCFGGGSVGIGTSTPSTKLEIDASGDAIVACKVLGGSEQIASWINHGYAPATWADFPTAVPKRTFYLSGQEAVGATNNYTSMTITARTSAAQIAFCSIGVIAPNAGTSDSTFFVNLRHGSGTTDYRTPFKIDSDGTFYLQCKNVGEDISMKFVQGSTTKYMVGYNEDQACFQIHSASAFTALSTADFSVAESGEIFMGNIDQQSITETLRYNSSTGEVTYYSSDQKLKHDIEKFKVDALSVLSSFDPKIWKWNKNEKDGVGWIAQEGVKAIPRMFPFNERTELYGISEFEILPYYHRAIQQLLGRVKKLENKLVKY